MALAEVVVTVATATVAPPSDGKTQKKIIDVEQKGKSEIKKTQRKEKRGSSKGTMKGNYEKEKGEAK